MSDLTIRMVSSLAVDDAHIIHEYRAEILPVEGDYLKVGGKRYLVTARQWLIGSGMSGRPIRVDLMVQQVGNMSPEMLEHK